jgi:hypothetical protein
MGDPGKGDHVERSLDDLTWEAYQELRATARRRLRRERGYHILQTTALRTKRSSGCCSLPHCSEKVFHSWVRDGIRDVYLRFVKSSAVVAHKAA